MRTKVTLNWDMLPLASQIVHEESGNLTKWTRIDLRLEPHAEHLLGTTALQLYEQTLLILQFETVDSLGRKLTR